jgi:hypothetical protein
MRFVVPIRWENDDYQRECGYTTHAPKRLARLTYLGMAASSSAFESRSRPPDEVGRGGPNNTLDAFFSCSGCFLSAEGFRRAVTQKGAFGSPLNHLPLPGV